MLLVIFGAGASYDSVPFLSPAIGAGADEEFRPPLAKDLFGPRQHFLKGTSKNSKIVHRTRKHLLSDEMRCGRTRYENHSKTTTRIIRLRQSPEEAGARP